MIHANSTFAIIPSCFDSINKNVFVNDGTSVSELFFVALQATS